MNLALYISPAQVDPVWPVVLPYLERTQNYHFGLDFTKQMIAEGKWQLWLGLTNNAVSSVCISEVITHQDCRTLDLLTMAGDGGNWNEMLHEIELFARGNGCDFIEIKGRRGWLRSLDGFNEIYTTVSKRITPCSSDNSTS